MYTKEQIENMNDVELLFTYQYLKKVDEQNMEYCVYNNHYDKFNTHEYARLRNETTVLKMQIELMNRGLYTRLSEDK